MVDPESNPKAKDREILVEKKFYQGNWNLWWIIATIFSSYFIFGRGIPWIIKEFKRSDQFPLVALLHFIGFIVFSVGCISNIFHTPSHGMIYKNTHVWVGRIVIIIGAIAQITGMIMTWTTRDEKASKRDISIGITIGGAITLISSFLGYIYIRKGRVNAHKMTMILMFFMGGLIPGLVRIPGIIPAFDKKQDLIFTNTSWMIGLALGLLAFFAMKRNSFF